MAYSFIKIERQKTHTILVLFFLLIILYFISALIFWMVLKNVVIISWKMLSLESQRYEIIEVLQLFLPSRLELFIVLLAALVGGVAHFLLSINNLAQKTLDALAAAPPNPADPYHKKFQNILEELCLAAGGANIKGAIINSSASNAFSLDDFEGQAHIGVSEGLLARLSRAQLEAVIAHEAAHILSGDSLAVTVACSLFGIYEAALTRLTASRSWQSDGVRAAPVPIVILYFTLSIVVPILKIFNGTILSCLSQQREFRADAIAVRLSRNPLALAQSLYIMSKAFSGELRSKGALAAIFTVAPTHDSSGHFASHPSPERRIAILLNMAHVDKGALEDMLKDTRSAVRKARRRLNKQLGKKRALADKKGWFALQGDAWQGPFLFSELTSLAWLRPHTLIRRHGAIEAKPASQDADLKPLFQPPEQASAAPYSCPYCYHGLFEINHEGVSVYRCPLCQGVFVNRVDIKKILLREDQQFPERIYQQAALIKKDADKKFARSLAVGASISINCPKCQKKVRRRLFSCYAPVEIDQCTWCDMVWLDRHELELLQVLYEDHPDKERLVF